MNMQLQFSVIVCINFQMHFLPKLIFLKNPGFCSKSAEIHKFEKIKS